MERSAKTNEQVKRRSQRFDRSMPVMFLKRQWRGGYSYNVSIVVF
jgi:hypothetical protein